MKKAQRNLSDCETLLAKRNFNKQEAKELTQLIDDMKNSSLRTNPELSQLEIKHAELERELEDMKAALIIASPRWPKYLMPSNRRSKSCWPKLEKAGSSAAALRTFLDQPKKLSNKLQKLMLFG